jgi:hypothetical protein
MESRQIRRESVVQGSAKYISLFMVSDIHFVTCVSCGRKLPHGLLSSSRCSPNYALGEVLSPYRLGGRVHGMQNVVLGHVYVL